MGNVNSSFLISLSIIALGFIAKISGIVKERDGDGIAKIILNFTPPAVVITAFSSMTIDYSYLLLVGICVVYGILMTVLALFIFRKRERKERGMLSMLVPSFNIGLFAYPLVEMIWGNAGLKYFGMFDMGNAFIVFGTNYILASTFSKGEPDINIKRIFFMMFRSVPFLAYIITLLTIVTHIALPAFFLDITKIVSRANMPLSLLLLGIYLSFNFDGASWKKMFHVIALRYGIGLCTGICLYILLPFDTMFRITVLLGFSLPISLAVIPYSVEFGYDTKFVGTVNNISILLSYIVVWIAIVVAGERKCFVEITIYHYGKEVHVCSVLKYLRLVLAL